MLLLWPFVQVYLWFLILLVWSHGRCCFRFLCIGNSNDLHFWPIYPSINQILDLKVHQQISLASSQLMVILFSQNLNNLLLHYDQITLLFLLIFPQPIWKISLPKSHLFDPSNQCSLFWRLLPTIGWPSFNHIFLKQRNWSFLGLSSNLPLKHSLYENYLRVFRHGNQTIWVWRLCWVEA